MAIATPEVYAEMIDRAKAGSFAYPAVNVTSSQTLTAALRGFAEAESDGIIQVSVGGSEYASGATVKDRVAGSLALAAYAAEVAKGYPVTIALHTDHCTKSNLDSWVRPLLEIEAQQVKEGKNPTFQSHMFDGSDIPLDENLVIAEELLAACTAANIILEIEIGVVGGEEDGVVGAIDEKLYTTPEDALATARALGVGEKGRYMTALTFGNVHGVYKPGNVKLRPEILKEIHDRAKRVLWLNPEVPPLWGTGDSEMKRYRPYCDLVRECSTLDHLERVTEIAPLQTAETEILAAWSAGAMPCASVSMSSSPPWWSWAFGSPGRTISRWRYGTCPDRTSSPT